MSKDSYIREMQGADNITIGILLGKAIKDDQVKPDEYDYLCKYVKRNGFSFRFIEFVKDK